MCVRVWFGEAVGGGGASCSKHIFTYLDGKHLKGFNSRCLIRLRIITKVSIWYLTPPPCRAGKKALFFSPSFLLVSSHPLYPPLLLSSLTQAILCVGVLEALLVKPVDYPYCFMTKAQPPITVLCHEGTTSSQTAWDKPRHAHAPFRPRLRKNVHITADGGPHRLLELQAWEPPPMHEYTQTHTRGWTGRAL